MAEVKLDHITKKYGDILAVSDVTLHIRDKEFVALVGPSGCGKSTTLRMIAGLEDITSGELFIDGKQVNTIAPKDRDIAMVFQNYALYPHMTVFDNMAFGLKLRKLPKCDIQQRVKAAAEIVGLTKFLDRRPGTLSGGQRQRVALGRAIVRNPKVFLFDEPLSNLDAKLRVQMRMEIARLQRRLGVTTVYVTHDQIEAMTMADRIAVMKDGVVQQFDSPMNLYNRPLNHFVASFIGSPSMNIIDGVIDEQRVFNDITGQLKLPLSGYLPGGVAPGKWFVGIRPENIHGHNRMQLPELTPIQVVINSIEPMGSDSFFYFSTGGEDLIARVTPDIPAKTGDSLSLYVDRKKLHFFHPKTGLRMVE